MVAPVQNQAIAEDVPLVDGKLWTESTQAEKKAFLVGISNLLNVEYAYQVRGINPPSNEQSIVPRLYEKIDDVTLDQAIRRVDQWYAKNPDKMNKPTLRKCK